jgi:hypothetical protein
MTLTLCRRPSSYATGQVEVLEDLNPYISQQAGVEGVDSNAAQRGEGKNPAHRDLAERGDFHAHFLDLKCILPERTALCGEILRAWHHAFHHPCSPNHVFSQIT